MLLQTPVVRVAIRRVDDEEIAKLAEPVGDHVVDDSALFVREERVLRETGLEPVEIVRQERLEQLVRARAFDVELAHVRDVEHPSVGSDGAVLLDHALVLDGHLPAGERHHPRAEGDMPVVQGRALERLRHARAILVSCPAEAARYRRASSG